MPACSCPSVCLCQFGGWTTPIYTIFLFLYLSEIYLEKQLLEPTSLILGTAYWLSAPTFGFEVSHLYHWEGSEPIGPHFKIPWGLQPRTNMKNWDELLIGSMTLASCLRSHGELSTNILAGYTPSLCQEEWIGEWSQHSGYLSTGAVKPVTAGT